MIERRRIYALIPLVLLAGSLTLILQKWVGDVTLYRPALSEDKRLLHEAILHNELPPGTTWKELGAVGVNTRFTTVYLAHAIHRVTKLEILRIYRWIDTIALFAVFLLLFAYLQQTSPPPYALVGLLYVAAILPLTYYFHYFHPWDRLSLACWIMLLMLLRSKRLIFFISLLIIAITIKPDVILIPALYFLANLTRGNWRRVAFHSTLMFLMTFGIWIGMFPFFPGGAERQDFYALIFKNVSVLRATGLAYPPLLSLLLPISLALIGLRGSDRFSRASVALGFLLCVPLLATTNFVEVRAEMPVVVLMLPAALIALRALCGDGNLTPGGGRSAATARSHEGDGPARPEDDPATLHPAGGSSGTRGSEGAR